MLSVYKAVYGNKQGRCWTCPQTMCAFMMYSLGFGEDLTICLLLSNLLADPIFSPCCDIRSSPICFYMLQSPISCGSGRDPLTNIILNIKGDSEKNVS